MKDILRAALLAGPPRLGFGARHFQNGLDPAYSGPRYGRSTLMDAYFQAGRKFRHINKEQ
ncbi:MAG: hypothetical protein KDC32_17090 [Saprospiraceae bacterium]|nr:hypothetical protein [Saprospiraceae bacterium]